MKPELTCPLGAACTEIKNNTLHQCAWYCEMSGHNPQTGIVENRKACAIAFLPLLLVENVGAMRGMQAATEEFRNHVARGVSSFVQSLSPLYCTDFHKEIFLSEPMTLPNNKEE